MSYRASSARTRLTVAAAFLMHMNLAGAASGGPVQEGEPATRAVAGAPSTVGDKALVGRGAAPLPKDSPGLGRSEAIAAATAEAQAQETRERAAQDSPATSTSTAPHDAGWRRIRAGAGRH